jgi:lysophospholipase L1-like esterase
VFRPTALLLAVLVPLTLTGCQASTAEPSAVAERAPLRLLVAGDSIVDGYYATTPERGFTALLEASLAQVRDLTSVVVAVSGARGFRVAAQVETATVGEDPFDVVVLEVGANDVGKSSLREWRDGYTRLLDAVAATSPDARVVCLGPWIAKGPTQPYLAVVRRLCVGQVVLGLGDLYGRPGLRGPAGTATWLGASDLFHPNDRGHGAIADRVLDAVARV